MEYIEKTNKINKISEVNNKEIKEIQKKAYAKLNIALDVVRKRVDGYHDMKMIMQTINLFDTIKIKKNNSGEIKLNSNANITENVESNLVYKAAKLVLEESGLFGTVGLDIFIEKNIPMGAGMAGGSADCATTILCLNELLELNLSIERMIDLGKMLGSDVPYCLVGGTKLVEGVGDIISPLSNHPQTCVLVAKPRKSISTKLIFENLNLDNKKEVPNFDELILGIEKGSVEHIAKNFCNVFEDVTIPLCEEIQEIKDTMNANGAINSLMTGTGSTVFGYFENEDDAKKCCDILRQKSDLELVEVTNLA